VTLVGREAETARLARLLDAARQGKSGALLLRGEAGIGKTALLAAAEARADGFRVHGRRRRPRAAARRPRRRRPRRCGRRTRLVRAWRGDDGARHRRRGVRPLRARDARRARRRTRDGTQRGDPGAESRTQLRAALESFQRLGARPWAERAAVELRATGETARRRDASTLDELTPQELQIARMVAEGGRNREIAGQLFLSPKTVEYHLRKVFHKLGIASRTELARLVVGDEPPRELAGSSASRTLAPD
jgi:DNA-binding CsgD family transcriptional regulator